MQIFNVFYIHYPCQAMSSSLSPSQFHGLFLKKSSIISIAHMHMGMEQSTWHGQHTRGYTTKEKWHSLSYQPSTADKSSARDKPPNICRNFNWLASKSSVYPIMRATTARSRFTFITLIRLRSWRGSNPFPLETSIWKYKVVIYPAHTW